MNKYQEYLEEAKNRYWNETTDEMLEYLRTERKHLKLLKDALIERSGLTIQDELKNNLIHIYVDDTNWENIFNLLIESCEKDICMIKAIIYKQIENGELFEDDEV